MLKTTIAGYPRIGNKRQLKKATESYFKGEITKHKLVKRATDIMNTQWQFLQSSGLSLIPSNDFSYYDLMLDTALLLNAVPKEYKSLNLDELDTCFACARGYKESEVEIKALPMRKWFNTNYHYIVPRLDSPEQINLVGNKPIEMFDEALNQGIKTKPVIIGPFTFLKLSKLNGSIDGYAEFISKAYTELIIRLDGIGAEWVQIDEPFLVNDLTKSDIALFKKVYQSIILNKNNLKLLLNTYFGDIRDIYKDVTHMGFDGYGLDFVEGQQTLQLIRENGFPEGKYLFAGLVDGRNIWRNDYEASLCILNELKDFTGNDKMIISTSCSLLHVPYSLESETKLDESKKAFFAFAQEKIRELGELSALFLNEDYKEDEKYILNQTLYSKMSAENHPIRQYSDDFKRKPDFYEREKMQKQAFDLPYLPLTTIGSFPQTLEIKKLRRGYNKGEISKNDYDNSIKEKIAECIKFQEKIGLDVLVHGEFERNDMVEYFGANLDGFLFTQNGWVQSYGTRCVKPPIIFSDISRKKPITVEYSKYAQDLTDKPVKGMLTGPVTILNWSFPRLDIKKSEMAFQIAEAIKEEVLDLESAGIRIIQIDEAALKEKLPIRKSEWHNKYLKWSIPAFRYVHSGVQPETQIHTHMCYSNFEEILTYIDEMDADVISFEAARSDLSILNAIAKSGFKTQVGPGVYDIHSPLVPKTQELVSIINNMLEMIPIEKLWINPDCGLKTRDEIETYFSLKNMAEAVFAIRKELKN